MMLVSWTVMRVLIPNFLSKPIVGSAATIGIIFDNFYWYNCNCGIHISVMSSLGRERGNEVREIEGTRHRIKLEEGET